MEKTPRKAFQERMSAVLDDVVRHLWEDDPPVVWFKEPGGDMVLVIAGPDKPVLDDRPDGADGIYMQEVDILEELKDWANPYEADFGGVRSGEQKADVLARIAALMKFSEDVKLLASRVESELG